MKFHTENYKDLEITYENSEYFRLVIFRLMFRTGLLTAGFIFLLGLIIEKFNIFAFILILGIMSFVVYLIIYRETYQRLVLKTPKRIWLQNNMLYIETLQNTYKLDLEKIKMLGRGPYWFIEMKDGTQYEFIIHHSITDDILKIWKKKYKEALNNEKLLQHKL